MNSFDAGDLGEAKGRQDLHTRREPERLRVLRQHGLVESAISSNRIEGVVVEQARVEQVVLGRAVLQDRDEQEVRGYRDALNWIHENHGSIRAPAETILRLHFLSHGQTGDAGQFKIAHHVGFEVGRYISIERLIEQNKERYYETLEQSSAG